MIRKFAVCMCLLLTFGWVAPAAQQSWTGTVSDDRCGAMAHDAACIEKCVAGHAKYVLVSKGKIYSLEPQEKFKGLGGKHVKVTGVMSGQAITASSVSVR